MDTLTTTIIQTIDCQELCALMSCALDYGYNFRLADELELCNPIEADIYFEQTMAALFDGRALAFVDKADNSTLVLTRDNLLKAAFEFAQKYPEIYNRVGGEDGYLPQVGVYILLVALYGWQRVATDIGPRFAHIIKLN